MEDKQNVSPEAEQIEEQTDASEEVQDLEPTKDVKGGRLM